MKRLLLGLLATAFISPAFASLNASSEAESNDNWKTDLTLKEIYGRGYFIKIEIKANPGIFIAAGETTVGTATCALSLKNPLQQDAILKNGRIIKALKLSPQLRHPYARLIADDDKVETIDFYGSSAADLEKQCGFVTTLHERTDLIEASLRK